MFAKSQRAIVYHKMASKKNFGRAKPLREKSPKAPTAHFGTVTIKAANQPFAMLVHWFVYFCGDFEPIADSRDFAKRHARLRHAEGTRIHPQENNALRATSELF